MTMRTLQLRRGVFQPDAFAQVRDFGVDVLRQRAPSRERLLAAPLRCRPAESSPGSRTTTCQPVDLADVPEFVPADARANGTLERLAHDRIGRAQRAAAIVRRHRSPAPRPASASSLASQAFSDVERVVRQLVVMPARDAEVGALFRIAIEIRRQVGVGQRLDRSDRPARGSPARWPLAASRIAGDGHRRDEATGRRSSTKALSHVLHWPQSTALRALRPSRPYALHLSYAGLSLDAVPSPPETPRRRRRTVADSGPSGLP